jgi:hypothetical protein
LLRTTEPTFFFSGTPEVNSVSNNVTDKQDDQQAGIEGATSVPSYQPSVLYRSEVLRHIFRPPAVTSSAAVPAVPRWEGPPTTAGQSGIRIVPAPTESQEREIYLPRFVAAGLTAPQDPDVATVSHQPIREALSPATRTEQLSSPVFYEKVNPYEFPFRLPTSAKLVDQDTEQDDRKSVYGGIENMDHYFLEHSGFGSRLSAAQLPSPNSLPLEATKLSQPQLRGWTKSEVGAAISGEPLHQSQHHLIEKGDASSGSAVPEPYQQVGLPLGEGGAVNSAAAAEDHHQLPSWIHGEAVDTSRASALEEQHVLPSWARAEVGAANSVPSAQEQQLQQDQLAVAIEQLYAALTEETTSTPTFPEESTSVPPQSSTTEPAVAVSSQSSTSTFSTLPTSSFFVDTTTTAATATAISIATTTEVMRPVHSSDRVRLIYRGEKFVPEFSLVHV